MEWKKSSQNIYLQLFCFAMFVIDLIAGINYLYERNRNAFFNVRMSFVWLFAWIGWGGLYGEFFFYSRYGGWSIKIFGKLFIFVGSFF